MERASNLTKKQFPSINFEPTDVVIVTWLDVGTFSTQSGVSSNLYRRVDATPSDASTLFLALDSCT